MKTALFSPEIIAHRGASFDAPENTRASILLAWQQNADAAEVDVHLCKDGEIVVMHDKNTLHTTGFDAEIASLTLAEIRQLEAGAWKGAPFRGEPVPTLGEILTLLPSEKRLYIEIKSDAAIIAPLKVCLERAGVAPAQIVIIGFSYARMKAAKGALPATEVLWLRGLGAMMEAGKGDFSALLDETIGLCHDAHLDGLDVSREWLENGATLERVREAQLKVCVYTINDGVWARRLAAAGVSGITSDRPAYLRKQLDAAAS